MTAQNEIYVGGVYWGPLEITRLIELNSEKQTELSKKQLECIRQAERIKQLEGLLGECEEMLNNMFTVLPAEWMKRRDGLNKKLKAAKEGKV